MIKYDMATIMKTNKFQRQKNLNFKSDRDIDLKCLQREKIRLFIVLLGT